MTKPVKCRTCLHQRGMEHLRVKCDSIAVGQQRYREHYQPFDEWYCELCSGWWVRKVYTKTCRYYEPNIAAGPEEP